MDVSFSMNVSQPMKQITLEMRRTEIEKDEVARF